MRLRRVPHAGSAVLRIEFSLISGNWDILIDVMFYCLHSWSEVKCRAQVFNDESSQKPPASSRDLHGCIMTYKTNLLNQKKGCKPRSHIQFFSPMSLKCGMQAGPCSRGLGHSNEADRCPTLAELPYGQVRSENKKQDAC